MRLAALGSIALLTARASLAFAATPEDAALAEELFKRGKALMQDGRLDEACPMLAESQKLDPGGGTILALGLCHEAQGRTASAWAELEEALTVALRDGETERAAVARDRLASLVPRLSKLTIVVSPRLAALSGLEVRRNGVLLPSAAWNLPMPIDPGTREVTVSAPGFEPMTASVVIEPERGDARLELPDLVPTQAAPRAEARPPRPAVAEPGSAAPQAESAGTWLALGGAAGGLSALAFLSAVAATVRAGDLQEAADQVCPGVSCSDRKAIADADEAGRWADAATGLVVVGSVFAAASVGLLVVPLATSSPASKGTVSLRLAPAGLRAELRW